MMIISPLRRTVRVGGTVRALRVRVCGTVRALRVRVCGTVRALRVRVGGGRGRSTAQPITHCHRAVLGFSK